MTHDNDSSSTNANTTAKSYAVNRQNVPVTMDAKLDDSDYRSQLADHDVHEWTRLDELRADRKLQCTVTSIQPGCNC